MGKTNMPNVPNLIMYQTEDGQTRLEVTLTDSTVWLSLNQLSELFNKDKSTISRHIKNIFEEGELASTSVVAKFATTAADGKQYQVDYYNLDVIISVGYRVKSVRGTQFRIWATCRLREYITKGFALNDELLKAAGGGVYFDELLERIRDIRSSEKVFWRKVLDIYATSIDYDLEALNGIVSAYLEFAEMQARRRIPMTMKDWIETLDGFLKLSKHEILSHAGKISAVMAEDKAIAEYEKYRQLHLNELSQVEEDYIRLLEASGK